MQHVWNQHDLSELTDPGSIDRVGHFVHGNQDGGYAFEMPLMGYQILRFTDEFSTELKREGNLDQVRPLVHEVRRGSLKRNGDDGWELRFVAYALIRNELDPANGMPLGEIDYASDLEYSQIQLVADDEAGLYRFRSWVAKNGLLDDSQAKAV